MYRGTYLRVSTLIIVTLGIIFVATSHTASFVVAYPDTRSFKRGRSYLKSRQAALYGQLDEILRLREIPVNFEANRTRISASASKLQKRTRLKYLSNA